MEHSLTHLNGNLLAGIDVETTGLDFEQHDVYQVAIIPVNQDMQRCKTRKWIDLEIKPLRPENIIWSGPNKVKHPLQVKHALEHGLDPSTAMDILQHWFDTQGLGSKRLAPIGHNYPFDSRFLRMWLGHMAYEGIFADGELRDTMMVARFMNDMVDFRGEPTFQYPKVGLSYLANLLKIDKDYGKAHTALADAAMTIDVYRRQMEELNKKMIF